MMNGSFSNLWVLGTLAALPVVAQQAEDTLVVDEQKDMYAIAEQVYQQARGTQDARVRAQSFARAADLLGNYVAKFPQAKNRNRAIYLQAHSQQEAGNTIAANANLGKLANETHGEYAAAAAYKLATQAVSRQQWDKALGYFTIVVQETKQEKLRNDALYRQGRAQLQLGKRAEAEQSFRSLLVYKNVNPAISQSALLSIAQMKTEDGMDAEAYELFRSLLAKPGLDKRVEGVATLQAARLAARLGKSSDSQGLYAKLTKLPGMEKYAAEAQMESVLSLFKEKKYEEVVRRITHQYMPLEDPEKEAHRALIIGQSYMEIRQYTPAVEWFSMVERTRPKTAMAADAGYRRIICVQQVRGLNFFQQAEQYLKIYAAHGSATATLPCVDLVRFMYADRMMLVDAAVASRQFEAINMEQLPEAVRADAIYKKAWCASRGDAYDPVPTLDHFINTYPQDPRLSDALALRGTMLMKQSKGGQALADFDRVIREFPDSEAAAVAWQRAAQLTAATQPQKMVQYYEGLIRYYENLVKRGGKDKPAAIAEAHYNIACALYETRPADAVVHFREARTMNAEQYASLVDLRLVQCFFKMKDADNLKASLRTLEQTNPGSYNGLPPAILRWCGWMCFQSHNYSEANKYLSDALLREPKEKYKAADGTEKERPIAEPIVWKTLARARLELRQFKDGLEAAEFYVAMENQPYRKAEGLRDQAQLLIGLKRSQEARKLCEQAIALGIDGPIKSSLFLSLGDAFFIAGEFAEAAKYYGRTANVVSDHEMKPMALYKIVRALQLCGKEGEAIQYEQNLKSEFPGWAPDAATMLLMEQAPMPQPAPAAPAQSPVPSAQTPA